MQKNTKQNCWASLLPDLFKKIIHVPDINKNVNRSKLMQLFGQTHDVERKPVVKFNGSRNCWASLLLDLNQMLLKI